MSIIDDILEHPTSSKRIKRALEAKAGKLLIDENKFNDKLKDLNIQFVTPDIKNPPMNYADYAMPLYKRVGSKLGGTFIIDTDLQRNLQREIQKDPKKVTSTKIKFPYVVNFSSIIFNVNPREVNWSFKQRATKQECKGGLIITDFQDKSRQQTLGFYAEPIMTATYQSGNILPVDVLNQAKHRDLIYNIGKTDKSIFNSKQQTRIPRGLEDLYKFLAIFDEPKIIIDPNTGKSSINKFHIKYSSYLFPDMELIGMFDGETEMPVLDNSADPFKQEWTLPFIVMETIPSFKNFYAMIERYNKTYMPKPNMSAYYDDRTALQKFKDENIKY